MRALRLAILSSALLCLALAQASCSFDPYCVNCGLEDAGPADASLADADVEAADALADADPSDACVPSGLEVCDGLDNDCNGAVDDGTLSGVGAPCSTDVGECEAGVTECVDGDIVCNGVLPVLEICDTLDNDCDGNPDNGNPGGGAFCGTDVGECTSGLTMCVDGDVSCQGNYDGTDELCNGLDDDCDNEYDEDIPDGGQCGPATDTGPCEFGVLQCVGGQMQCVGPVYPALEQCDTVDHDCDGNPTNGFDLDNDPFNCGVCGHSCAAEVTAGDPQVSLLVCETGNCKIALCASGYWNNNNIISDGCEFGPCTFENSTDVCNLNDDDCDGDVDEDAVEPVDFCDPDGECADPPGSGNAMSPTCTAAGWICDYENHPSGGVVSTDGANHITPEDLCDGLDNDCDVAIDETFGVGNTCDDGDIGRCRELGVVECNGAGATQCNVTDNIHPGDFAETCNGVDDDCNNVVDDGAATGSLHAWVDIGGVEMFAYEASRPDATDTSAGAIQTHPCSGPDVVPWTNVRHPDAEAACLAVGARLCTEAEWQAACELAEPPTSSPVEQGPGPNYVVWIEAENFDTNTAQGGHSWVADTTSGYSHTGAMRSTPDDGTTVDDPNIETDSPHLEFQVNFTQSGTHYLWARVYADDNNDDCWHMGLDGTAILSASMDTDVNDAWRWENEDLAGGDPTVMDIPSPGVHTLDVWMRQDNLIIDAIVLTTSSSYTPTGINGGGSRCGWSHENNCETYQPDVCNGNDYDGIPGGADDDVLANTGAMAQCFADWDTAGHIFDMSGNVKEWTAERAPGVNPLRGGAYNTPSLGMRCDADFIVGDDSFFFPNVGFRCCR